MTRMYHTLYAKSPLAGDVQSIPPHQSRHPTTLFRTDDEITVTKTQSQIDVIRYTLTHVDFVRNDNPPVTPVGSGYIILYEQLFI